MRAVLLDKAGSRLPDHLGLAYERWAPLDPATGKVPDERRKDWLRGLAAIPICEHYRHAYNRWLDSLKTDDTQLAEVRMASRLLVGHGNPSPTEVGLTVHPTWGVPMIPGSALKGLLSHYVDAVYGPIETGLHPMDSAFPEGERDRAPFRGVTWNGTRIQHGPGEVYRALFGAPAAQSDKKFEDLGAGETTGLVVFHDALFVPTTAGDRPFAVDVLTVHQKGYYDRRGQGAGPTDYEDPNPVSFLTVRPGAKFLIALSGPSAWTRLAFGLLRDVLVEWGVGGKTTSGYGHIEPEGWAAIWPTVETGAQTPGEVPKTAVPLAEVVKELHIWLAENIGQRQKLDAFRAEWLPRLQACSASDKEEATKLIRKAIKSPKLKEERDALIEKMNQSMADKPDGPRQPE